MPGLEELLAGRTLVRRYRIEEVIGRGGFAAVYRATDERLGRPVAVKVITLAAADEEARERHRERFEREARSAASLPQHPNVVTVHDFGVDPQLGLDFLVMEFLHGQDLASFLRTSGRPPLDMATRILRDAAEGLAVGHRANLLHRDVKPGNIFLAQPHGEDSLRVCVLDFGIARALTEEENTTRLTHEGTPLSPAYASPEQFRGERDLTCASDVFSLGVVGYQLLTGEKPFRQERTTDPSDWVPLRGIRDLNPEVPPEVEAVVNRALAMAPESRFPDADAFTRALDAALEGPASTGMAAAAASAAALGAGAGATLAMGSAPAAAPRPPLDEEHTVLQPEPAPAPPPPAAPAPRAQPVERKRSAALWVVPLVLVIGAAGLWAVTSGGDGGGQDASGLPPVVLPEGGGPPVVEGAPTAGGGATPGAGSGSGAEPAVATPAQGAASTGSPVTTAPAGAAPAAPAGQQPAAISGGTPAPAPQQPAAQAPPAAGTPAATPPAAQPAANPPGGQQTPTPAAEPSQPRLLGVPVQRPDSPQPQRDNNPGGGGGNQGNGGGGGNNGGGGGPSSGGESAATPGG